ncbi:outer membrane protein assembly factor BamC [Suttonella ornithocola]|uniref:NlpB/DapX lipoprotein n=1 Tax=Suttonella ornithocola TaxID=279832 RepID=A0A380MQJ9_9GAMM|nr:outer membrane protein assembly factor BamC [Suttonella ornithocola]SUO94582.1 NlpB/DapX lipoprotein [Suttonella ornithocola]
MKKTASSLFTAFLLTACSSGSLIDNLPNRAPDYRQSNVSRKIEVPPDLTGGNLDNSLAVNDFTPASVTSYNDYQAARVKRNQRGFIEVLPPLYGVQVVEPAGQLPYIVTAADPSTSWSIVKKYWQNNGIRLTLDNPSIGIMETDWLEDKGDAPKTGISGLLNGLLGFLKDSDERDRYRLRFSRNAQGGTDILLIYSKTEQVAQYDLPSGRKNPAGFKWQLSDNKNPELQLEMTRRIALYLSTALEKMAGVNQSHIQTNQPTAANNSLGMLSTLNDGSPALLLNGRYAQNWRTLGIALDRASFTILSNDYPTGTYRVRYTPQSDKKNQSFFSRLWGSKDAPENQRPEYLVRLSDQGGQSIAIVQTANGGIANPAQAKALLESVYAAL